MEPGHMPVMPREITEFFRGLSSPTIVDGTSGGGGHTLLLQRAYPDSRILAFERDPSAAGELERIFAGTGVQVFNRSYTEIPQVIGSLGLDPASAALFDLGLSSIQLDSTERGFSHRSNGPLDMRFNRDEGEPASVLLSRMTEKQIADVIYKYGEEGRSRVIAKAKREPAESPQPTSLPRLYGRWSGVIR